MAVKSNVIHGHVQGLRRFSNRRQLDINMEWHDGSGEYARINMARLADLNRCEPGLQLETNVGKIAQLSQQNRRAKGGMARKRHFATWKENAHLRRVRRIVRLHHEGCFRKVELAGDRLHLLRRQMIGIKYYSQRIATEAAVGKNIKGMECQPHGRHTNQSASFASSPILYPLSA